MGEKTEQIKDKLKVAGLSDEFVRAAWPGWWSDEAELSPSALNDLKFSVARRLGIAPNSLFDEGNATFVWQGDAKFKGLSAASTTEEKVLNAFGGAIARSVLSTQEEPEYGVDYLVDADEVRLSILNTGASFVQFTDLLAYSWSLGIPVIYLRVFPLTAKRMAAMTVRYGDRYVILLGRDFRYPCPLAFILAHELGHIACRHLPRDSSLIDQDLLEDRKHQVDDAEEIAADKFALKLLTGRSDPIIDYTRPARTSTELAYSVRSAAVAEKIEPGTFALCYGYATGNWQVAQGALKILYPNSQLMWTQVNNLAHQWMDWEQMTPDALEFIHTILGLS